MPVTCYGGNDGSATINVSQGYPGYSYLWYNLDRQKTATATGLLAGIYRVLITDAVGCTAEVTINIPQPSPLEINSEVISVRCNGGNDGSVSIIASGGSPPYVYAWFPTVSINNTASNLSAGNYTVVVNDTNNCTDSIVVVVSEPEILTLEISGEAICQGQNATLTANVEGGTAPYFYNWDPGAMTASSITVTPSDTTTYTIEVKDFNNCSAPAQTIILYVYPSPVAEFTMTPPQYAPVSLPIIFNDQSSGATQWLWNFGDIMNSSSMIKNPTFTYDKLGSYLINLTVTNDYNCSDSVSHIIYIESNIYIYIPNAFTPDNDGINDFFSPQGVEFTEFEMEIYNRWGERIYHSIDMDKPWDGKYKGRSEKPDVYVYKIWVKDFKEKMHYYVGNVTLIK